MEVTQLEAEGLRLIKPRRFEDERGYFYESFSAERYRDAGIADTFVQDNVSMSRRGVLRGLHLQEAPYAQAKLIQVLQGEVFDVVVDLRPESATFAKWYGRQLSDREGLQLYVPPGFAHGFVVTSELALFSYKCSVPYVPAAERVLLWNDPDLAIDWRVRDPIVSEKDADGKRLRELAELTTR